MFMSLNFYRFDNFRCYHVQTKIVMCSWELIYQFDNFRCFHVQTKLWCAVHNYIHFRFLMCDKIVMCSWELIYQFVSMCRQNCDVHFTIIFILDVLIYHFDNFRCCHVQTNLWYAVHNYIYFRFSCADKIVMCSWELIYIYIYINLTILDVVMCRQNCDVQFRINISNLFPCRQNCDVQFTIIFILGFSFADKIVMCSCELFPCADKIVMCSSQLYLF
jgi:hypothetical protein